MRDDAFRVVGADSDALGRESLSQRARTALTDVENLGVLTVGDPTPTLADATSDAPDSVDGDPSTVAIETKSFLIEPDELERQAEAVAAVATALEAATPESLTA